MTEELIMRGVDIGQMYTDLKCTTRLMTGRSPATE